MLIDDGFTRVINLGAAISTGALTVLRGHFTKQRS
jgi:hypothetical protein